MGFDVYLQDIGSANGTMVCKGLFNNVLHNRWKYSLKVHIVLVTKYRKQLLKDSIADDVKQKIFDIANTYGYEIIAIETDKDHIHRNDVGSLSIRASASSRLYDDPPHFAR